MKKILVVWLVALVALPTMAQSFVDKDQPTATFQSTSVMQTSGSAYASQPALNEDGTAYNPSSAATASSGPRKMVMDGTPDPVITPQKGPVGDAVLPLMLMALVFGGYIAIRRRMAKRVE